MVITQEQLIKEIANREGENVASVRDIITGMENLIYAYLSSATPTEDVTVKILNGVSITSKYVPGGESINPKTQEKIMIKPRIWSFPRVTWYYNNKLNQG